MLVHSSSFARLHAAYLLALDRTVLTTTDLYRALHRAPRSCHLASDRSHGVSTSASTSHALQRWEAPQEPRGL